MKSMRVSKQLLALVFCLWLGASLATAGETVNPPFVYYELDKTPMLWGDATNGIKAGLLMAVFTNQQDVRQNGVWCVAWMLFTSNSATKFYVGYPNSDSNCCIQLREARWVSARKEDEYTSTILEVDAERLLPIERNYQMTLTDAEGKLVSRTDLGEKFRHAFYDNPIFEENRYSGVPMENGQVTPFIVDCRLNDFFILSKPGKYHLRMQVRIFCCYAKGTSYRRHEPLILPPVEADFILP